MRIEQTRKLFTAGILPTPQPTQDIVSLAQRLEALRLVFAAEDPKGGAVVSGPRLYAQPTCHHRPEVLGGIGEEQAAAQLRRFFAERRD